MVSCPSATRSRTRGSATISDKEAFEQAWDEFIPGLPERVRGGREYLENCGSCGLRRDCSWCPAYGYLEHGRYSARVDYLCRQTEEKERTRRAFEKGNRRYYQVGELTVQVDSDLPITDATFHPKFKHFEVEKPGDDIVRISHHFRLPDLDSPDLGTEVHRKSPWIIYRKKDSWIYRLDRQRRAGRPPRPGRRIQR